MIGFMVSNMDEKKLVDKEVPYIVFESTICRFDRVIKRLWIIILVLVFLLLGTNLAWLYYESQFEDVTTETTTVTQDVDSGENGDAIINDGVHINGKGETDSKNNETQDQKA